MKRLRLFIPLIVFVFLSALLYWGMSRDPDHLPSVLIDKPLPGFNLPTLNNPAVTVTRDNIIGKPFIMNFWASWCTTCKQEHAFLNELAAKGIQIVGVNYKDDADAAKAILKDLKDPYVVNVVDQSGRYAIDMGVFGAPESFVVDANGIILEKVIGAIDEGVWQTKLAKFFSEK